MKTVLQKFVWEKIPAGQGICVGRRYQISATSDHALTFDWTTDLGSITGVGVTTTLDLTQVTASNAPFQVQITASPRAANQACLDSPPATTATFYFRDTPIPQNLRLDGNPQLCSTPATRTVRVDPVANATQYNWTLSGPGNFNGFTALATTDPFIALTFTGAGTVQVLVTAQDNCNRVSPATTANFTTADPNAAPAPLPANLLANYNSNLWHVNQPALIPVSNPQSGVTYAFTLLDTNVFTAPNGPYYPGNSTTPGGTSYAQLATNADGISASITILSERVASATVQVMASNGCGTNTQTQSQTYTLARPFHGSYNRVAAGAVAENQGSTNASAPKASAMPQLYPNPAHDQLQIVAPSPNTRYEYVVLLNAQGTVVQEARSTEGVQMLSLQALPIGIYAMRLFDGQQFVTLRVAKE